MLKLQGVRIGGYRSFHEYFDFAEIYALLCSDDAYVFREFLEDSSIFSASSRALQCLRGVNRLDGRKNRNTGDLRYIKEPALCENATLILDPVFVRCSSDELNTNQLLRLRNVDAFAAELNLISQTPFQELYPQKYNNDPANEVWAELRDSIHSAVLAVTENGTRCFCYEAATELYIYFLLHALAAVKPNNKASLDALKQDLDKLCGTTIASASQDTCISLVAGESNSAYVPLPYYDGKEKSSEPLSIVELKNPSAHNLTVSVRNTILSRQLHAGESIYALRKGAKFVSFIPRFRLNDKTVTYLWDGSVYEKYNHISNEICSKIEKPVSWVRSAEYGVLILDICGNLDDDNAWPEIIPEKPIIAVDAYALNYAMLLNDGTLSHNQSPRLFAGKRFLTVCLGMNAMAGIDQERNVWLSSGKTLSNVSAVDVRVHQGHFVCLLPNGGVITDSNLIPDDTVYAIAISSRGYILAYGNMIALYSFENEFVKQWSCANVTEIEADESGLAYYNGLIGEVETLCY